MFEWANQNKDAVWWRRRIGLFCVVAGLGWYVNHLEQVPVSGRQRFIGVSIAREEEIGLFFFFLVVVFYSILSAGRGSNFQLFVLLSIFFIS